MTTTGKMLVRLGVFALPAVIACQSAAPSQSSVERYLVTATPIAVGEGITLCAAVDPDDPHGIWNWMPGETGCLSRSSGPAPFHPDAASVSRTTPGTIAVTFRLGTHSASRPFIDVRLIVEHDTMRSMESHDSVPIQRRRDLDVPEKPMRGR